MVSNMKPSKTPFLPNPDLPIKEWLVQRDALLQAELKDIIAALEAIVLLNKQGKMVSDLLQEIADLKKENETLRGQITSLVQGPMT